MHYFLICCYFLLKIRIVLVCFFYILQNDLIEGDLLLVRIIPDEEGKFGFNLKVNQQSFSDFFKMLYRDTML